MLKILHADDHALFREGMSYLLTQLDAELELLGSNTLPQALELSSAHPDLDMILLDLNMPGMNGTAALQTLWQHNPATPVVVLSGSENPRDVEASLDQGAAGYIPKSSPSKTLLNALDVVLNGGIYAPRLPRRTNDLPPAELTERQQQVLALLAEGWPNKLIARKLFITEATVKGHVSSILNALDVSNRTQAVAKAQTIGLLRSA